MEGLIALLILAIGFWIGMTLLGVCGPESPGLPSDVGCGRRSHKRGQYESSNDWWIGEGRNVP